MLARERALPDEPEQAARVRALDDDVAMRAAIKVRSCLIAGAQQFAAVGAERAAQPLEELRFRDVRH
jgi:hypothetical protein